MKTVNIVGKVMQLSEISEIIVGLENKAEKIRFTMPKMYGDVDLSAFTFYLQFENRDGQGEPVLLTKAVSGDNLNIDWEPGGSFTQVCGRVEIAIYGLLATEDTPKRWSTKPGTLYIADSLDPEEISDLGPTVLIQYLADFQEIESIIQGCKNAAFSSAGTASQAKTDAITAKNDAVTAKNEAVTAKNASVSAKNDSETAKNDSVAAKNASEAAKTEAVRAEAAAKGFRDEAMALAGVGNHVTNPMPHKFQVGNTWYKYGFRATSDGTVQFIYEEVV